MSDYTHSFRKYTLSLRSSSISSELYKNYELVGKVKTALTVVGAYKIYT